MSPPMDPSRHFAVSINLVAIGGIADIGRRWDWMPRWRMSRSRHPPRSHANPWAVLICGFRTPRNEPRGWGYEAARVHQSNWWRSGRVATLGERATVGDACDRLYRHRFAELRRLPFALLSPRSERNRLRR